MSGAIGMCNLILALVFEFGPDFAVADNYFLLLKLKFLRTV